MPRRHVIHRFVEHKLRVELIDGIVGEMDECLVKVGRVGLDVRLRRKPCQPLLKQINPKRISTRQQHIYSEIELQPINQVGPRDIPLYDVVFAIFYILDIAS